MTTQFNNLLPEQNPTRYSEEQSQMFDLVKSLKDSGLGYRKVAQELNNRGLTTHTGQEWSSAYVYAVILRHEQRIERQNHRQKTYPLIYSKMWIE